MAGVYRPRYSERTVLYRVLFHHFERFVAEYEERFEKAYGYFRPIVKDVVEKYLDCGNPRSGFARIRCPRCRAKHLLMFLARPETKLLSKEFYPAQTGSPYTSPATGAWINPGPARGPYKATLADFSTVTYYWYRFIDQPVFQQFGWSDAEKAQLQSFVEKIHAGWSLNRDYMPPPSSGPRRSASGKSSAPPSAGSSG